MSLFKGLKRRFKGIKDHQFTLQDDSDGRGPRLIYLDPALGAIPTLEELGALGELPVVPDTVTKRQFFLALFDEGRINHLRPAIQSGSARQQIDWDNSTDIKRSDELVAAIMSRANLSADQMDAIFIRAIGL